MNGKETFVVAWNSNKEQGPFYCPKCKREAILKKGEFVLAHFAHAPGSNCTYGTGESWEHWRAKYEMYQALREYSQVSNLQVELPLGVVRPDIYFCWENTTSVAIELQRSSLAPKDVARRTSSYTAKNIAVLWVSLRGDRFWAGERCSTRLWERYIHELYNGKIYCWHGGQELLVTQFEPYVLQTEYR